MFSTKTRTKYELFLRQVESGIDENILTLFMNHNKAHIDAAFFKNSMACSWSLGRISDLYEVLFLAVPSYVEAKDLDVQEIFRSVFHNFQIPQYSEYKQYIDKQMHACDLLTAVRRVVTDESIILQTEQAYSLQIEAILKICEKKLFSISELEYKPDELMRKSVLEDKVLNIKPQVLSFIGHYFDTVSKEPIKDVLVYKILEKIFGMNEASSIYYSLRQKGRIYTAITSCYIDKNRFVTGVMATYSDELFEEVQRLVSVMQITSEKLTTAKMNYLNELKFSAVQYGELFALYTYCCKARRKVHIQEIELLLNQLTVEDVNSYLPKVSYAVRVGVD